MEDNYNRDSLLFRNQVEARISNLNSELENEKHSRKELSNNLKKTERKLKDMTFDHNELFKKMQHLQVYLSKIC